MRAVCSDAVCMHPSVEINRHKPIPYSLWQLATCGCHGNGENLQIHIMSLINKWCAYMEGLATVVIIAEINCCVHKYFTSYTADAVGYMVDLFDILNAHYVVTVDL